MVISRAILSSATSISAANTRILTLNPSLFNVGVWLITESDNLIPTCSHWRPALFLRFILARRMAMPRMAVLDACLTIFPLQKPKNLDPSMARYAGFGRFLQFNLTISDNSTEFLFILPCFLCPMEPSQLIESEINCCHVDGKHYVNSSYRIWHLLSCFSGNLRSCENFRPKILAVAFQITVPIAGCDRAGLQLIFTISSFLHMVKPHPHNWIKIRVREWNRCEYDPD